MQADLLRVQAIGIAVGGRPIPESNSLSNVICLTHKSLYGTILRPTTIHGNPQMEVRNVRAAYDG
jgi:hypothetical protein